MQVRQLLTRTAGALGVTAGLLFVGSPLMAQVKIGDNPNSISPNSILELESATKGLLSPRVQLQATNQATPLTAPIIAGTRVFNTNTTSGGDYTVSPGEYYWDGSSWVRLVTEIATPEVYREGEPTVGGTCGSDPEGTIWNDISDNATGQQWICRSGVWAVYDSPTSRTPFNFTRISDNKVVDAGPRKSGTIYRYGIITTQNPPSAPSAGAASLFPSGGLRLLRVPNASLPNQGAFIDFGRNPANPSLFRISLRNDLNNNQGALAFNTQTGGDFSARMVVGFNGQVGINTTDPLRLLHVRGSALFSDNTSAGVLIPAGSSPNDGVLISWDDDAKKAGVAIQSSGSDINLSLTKRSSVVGDDYVIFRTNLGNAILGTIEHSAGATINFGTTSDRRLKENINDTHYSINDLMKISVVDYNYKIDETKTRLAGFIAQDLHKVYPQAVSVGGDDAKTKPWTLDYGKLTPLLVKAIQDQQKEIAALKAQLSEMNALKAEVASIKAMLDNAAQQKSEATISK